MGKLFGTDGVRGISNEKLSIELAVAISRSVGTVIRADMGKRPRILLGIDTRLSGGMLSSAVSAGFASVGCDVELLGVVPTPAVAYLTATTDADGGVMITASHNPYEYNGIKCFGATGYKLTDEQEARIESMVLDDGDDTVNCDDTETVKIYKEKIILAAAEEVGNVTENRALAEKYIDHIASAVGSLDGLKIAVDCANGASYEVAKRIFEKTGAKATFINNLPNGRNVNDNCGSLHIEGLSEFVKNGDFDLGVAFDGDADRCIAVYENGKKMDGDVMMAILAKRFSEEGKLRGNIFVPTIMSNMGLFKFAEKEGFTCYPTKVGDRYVLESLLKYDASLGGEQSGHIIIKNYMTTGDGELTALMLAETVKKSGKSASELRKVMTEYPQVLENIEATQDMKNRLNDPEVRAYINIASGRLGSEGRILVRPSGTEPLIRIMIEGSDEKKIRSLLSECAETLKNMLR